MSEIDQLIFKKRCPFASECQLREELEEEKGKVTVLESQIEQYKNDFHEILRKVTETFALRNYVERLSKILEVKAIYLVRREKILDIWTIISESNLDIEEEVAEVQCELMRIFKELEFDFMIVPADQTEINALLPKNAIKYFQRIEGSESRA